MQAVNYTAPRSQGVKVTRVPAAKTGTTYRAPKVAQMTPRSTAKKQMMNQLEEAHKESNK